MMVEHAQNLPTSKGHQWLSLIGATFVIFEIVFIGFYSNNFWFSLDLAWYGVPTVVILLALSHFVLLAAQGRPGCWLAWPLLKGKPPIMYTRWLTIDAAGFTCGRRRVDWQAVDEAPLTFFGNLTIRSYAICGKAQTQPDVVFKFAFTPASQAEQQKFVEALKVARPDLVLNQRLEKRLHSPIVRGQNIIQALGGAMMLVLLLDLGYSSFYYLNILKLYYLAEVEALSGDSQKARHELSLADTERAHPLPISYICNRLLGMSSCAAALSTVRADALWYLHDPDAALVEAKKTLEYTPDNFRCRLHYIRFLERSGQSATARQEIEQTIDKHKDWLLPRLYLLANTSDKNRAQVKALYKSTMDDLKEQLFVNEPVWPPGGETFVHDLLYSHDIYFVFDRLLSVPDQNRSLH